ncbi:hypothetical protein C8R42DRAFT_715439 [Lentinula raphanica]|nr:hypothetical protein C8R42DRAFT_715439 [Lentinula raphanica]
MLLDAFAAHKHKSTIWSGAESESPSSRLLLPAAGLGPPGTRLLVSQWHSGRPEQIFISLRRMFDETGLGSTIADEETPEVKHNLRRLSSDDHEPSGNPIELKNASTFHDLQRSTLGFGASVEMPAIDDRLPAGLTSENSLDISMPDVTCGKGLVADGVSFGKSLSVSMLFMGSDDAWFGDIDE